MKDQYGRLWDYDELRTSNPRSPVKMMCERRVMGKMHIIPSFSDSTFVWRLVRKGISMFVGQ